MPKKADPIKKRLLKAIENVRSWKSQCPAPISKRYLSRPENWESTARNALTIEPDPGGLHCALERAFKALDLDAEDPRDWRTLADALSWVLFPIPARVGRSRTWNTERFCELLDAVDVRRRKNPQISEERACELIAADNLSPSYFRSAGAAGLRKALQKARHYPKLATWKAFRERALPLDALNIPNFNWVLLIPPTGNLGLPEYEELASRMEADPMGCEALLLSRWRERKELGR